MQTFRRLVLVVAAALALGVLSVQAQDNVLIQVDVTHSNAVIFSATSNHSWSNDTSFTLFDGFELLSFLTSTPPGVAANVAFTGTLAPSLSAALPYDYWVRDDHTGGPNLVDLNFFRLAAGNPEVFSNSAPAFTGASTIDLSSIAAYLPINGAYGNIMLGFSGTPESAPVIGQWQAIPEPSALALVLLGTGTVLWVSRRQRR